MADRNVVVLKCSVCKNENYFAARGRKKGGDRAKVEVRKFCGKCHRHETHKESKL